MTILDDTLPAEVVAVLSEYGKNVTFTEAPGPADYDATTGRTTQASPASYVVKSAPPYRDQRQFVAGNTVEEGDSFLLIEATGAGFTPKVGQKVTIDSAPWRAVGVFPIYSGENVVAFEVQVRK